MARQNVVHVRHKAAVHTSGTKFYEIFLFENDFGGFFISRYGKFAQAEAGGQESFDAADPSSSIAAYENKQRQKFSPKGGYTSEMEWNATSMGAALRCHLHPDFSRMFRADDPKGFNALRDALNQIFSSSDVFQQLCNALNLPGVEDGEIIPIPVFEEVPEEVRAADESWGAW